MPYPPNLKEKGRRDTTRVLEDEDIRDSESEHNQEDEMIEEGFVVVAADGACPNQATKRQLQRAGCGLYYGKKHPWNFKEKIYGSAQGAQRGELQAAKV